MSLIDLKCTNCGGVLKGDPNQDAMICPHCGSAFIVQNAINNYNNTYNVVNNINANVVNVKSQDATTIIKRAFIVLENKDFEYAEKLFNDALIIEPENGDAYLGLLLAENGVSDIENLEIGIYGCENAQDFFTKNKSLENAIKYGNIDTKNRLIKLKEDNLNVINKKTYEEAVSTYKKINGIKFKTLKHCDLAEHKLLDAIFKFESLKNYKDSSKYINLCKTEYDRVHNSRKTIKQCMIVDMIFILLLAFEVWIILKYIIKI